MYAKFLQILFTAGSAILLFGCAANQHAQDLSRETLIQVLEYQTEMQGISRTLKANYDKRLARLKASSGIQLSVDRTFRHSALAENQMEKVIKHGFLSSDLRGYLTQATEEHRLAEGSYHAALTSMQAKHTTIASNIGFKESQLQTLRTRLERLQSNESSQELIRQILPLLRAAR